MEFEDLEDMEVEFYIGDDLVGKLLATPKEFKTGSKGLYAFGKISDDQGNTYQVSCNMVIIGSKQWE